MLFIADSSATSTPAKILTDEFVPSGIFPSSSFAASSSGSFLLPNLKSIEEEIIIRGISYEIKTEGQVSQIKREIGNPEINMEVIQLEKAPKIVRLKSKVCKIISDHEDVLDYDAFNYPPGTNKISKFIVLDVE